LKYSSGRNDRTTNTAGIQLNYPFTPLLHGGTYINYSHVKLLTTENTDDRTVVGGKLNYQFSRKLKGLFDIKYRTKESTRLFQTYNEFSVYASIVYGFGQVYRPTRAGGF
jgi:predicted porin